MRQPSESTALRPDTADDARRPSFDMHVVDMRDVKLDEEQPLERKHRSEERPKATLRDRFAGFPWKPFWIISSLPLALVPIVLLAALAEIASTGYIQNRPCYPNGLWSEAPGATWRIMDSSYFFTPNLSFGSMSFTAAKIIDISWDLCAGRGGQILLAWVNYRVFNEWLLYHMELHQTSYKMYTAVAFQTTSMSTLGVLAKEFLAFGETSWRRFFRWLGILCMLLSTLYVLSFPTLMGALTGYITTSEAYIEDSSNNLIEFSKFSGVQWIIWDSDRMGKNYTKPLIAAEADSGLVKAIDICKTPFLNRSRSYSRNADYQRTSDPKAFLSTDPTLHMPLGPPTLNITWFGNGTQAYSPHLHYLYYSYDGRQGDPIHVQWLLSHGSCKPSDTYQWGFSYIFLFMVSIFNFVWSCIMIGMWFDTSRASRMYKSGRRPGLLKSILDISDAMKEELGEGADALEEEELRKALRGSGGVLVVSKGELKVTRTGTGGRKRGWRRNLTKGSTF
ncbi:hypothetical protein K491DRAFT_669993 [Lophiostoma macrostomum CBS 122681]|uniref:Uncharacterized protein n=1 Tax=Lophiostoma macrostomum CBS 122681 TaxID=1314788 RepID=A0A6A6SMS8_9PLEO|nr:hypothetical protein K491DRAFT_669993 [Lophiostoma macrostomum CBS 122681]